MEIFIATSIKSFDLNPTHPGPASKRKLPHAAAQLNNPAQKKSGGRRSEVT